MEAGQLHGSGSGLSPGLAGGGEFISKVTHSHNGGATVPCPLDLPKCSLNFLMTGGPASLGANDLGQQDRNCSVS